jgi:hypothetical protein
LIVQQALGFVGVRWISAPAASTFSLDNSIGSQPAASAAADFAAGLDRGHDRDRQLRGAEGQYTAFAERRRVEAKGSERYVDDLAATAKLLEGERHLPKPRGKRKRDV